MSLRFFCGEYLLDPEPLMFDMNTCDHGCFYCFANGNREVRRANNNDLARIAKWFAKGEGPLPYWYLKNGHPMVISNNCDPFARTNAETFKALRELAASCGFRYTIMTKGGDREAEELALNDPPTMWYITIETDREDWRKKIAPRAPSIEHRIELAKRAVEHGHFVMIGLNPLVPEWWDDIMGTFARLREAGIGHIWYATLHFSRFQRETFPEATRRNFGLWLDYGMKKGKTDNDDIQFIANRLAEDLEFNCYNGVRATTPGFFDPYFAKLGYPFFPVLDDWFALMKHYGEGKPVVFDFESFLSWISIPAPQGFTIYGDYLQSFARSVRNTNAKISVHNWREVLEWLWQVEKFPSPLRASNLSLAAEETRDELIKLVDEKGRPLMVYTPEDRKLGWFDTTSRECLWLLGEDLSFAR